MDDLIAALKILRKYMEDDDYLLQYPTNCDHDVLRVSVDPAEVSTKDKKKLAKLGFLCAETEWEEDHEPGEEFDPDTEEEFFYSHRFGSN